jgi:hypothetical protein
MTDSSASEVKSAAAQTAENVRAELAHTLDAIEDKFDVKQRASELSHKVQRSYEENPVPWIIGATAAVIAVGGLVAWAIFGDD